MKTIEQLESEIEMFKMVLAGKEKQLAEAKKPKFGPDEIITVDGKYCVFFREVQRMGEINVRRLTPRELRPTLEAMGVKYLSGVDWGFDIDLWVEWSER